MERRRGAQSPLMEYDMESNIIVAGDVKVERDEAPVHPLDDQNHVTRQEYARQQCLAAGLTWPGTILPPGTALYDSGIDQLRSDRQLWKSKPDARTAVLLISAALEAEDRADYRCEVKNLRLREDNGRIASVKTYKDADKTGMGYSPHSFRQVIQQIPALAAAKAPRGMTSALLYLSDSERAEIVNARIEKAEMSLTLRTKLSHNGQRIIRAGLSEKYGDVSDIHVGDAIVSALNGRGSTVKLDYKPGDSRSRFELIFPSELPIKTFRVGDVHYAMLSIKNSETGEGSIEIQASVLRAACANLTLSTGKGITQRIIHVGDSDNLRNKVKAAIMAAEAQLMPLIAAIQKSAETPVSYTPGDLIAKLAKALNVPTDRARDWQDTLEHKYLPEVGMTTWAVTNAITDSAQRASNWVNQEREELIAARITSENGVEWAMKKGAAASLEQF